MRPWATSGRPAGAIALLVALTGCGMGSPATGTAGSLPISMAQTPVSGNDTGSGKTVLSENTAMMDQSGAAGMMATGIASGSMMSGDMMSQMTGMMSAGSTAGGSMSGGKMPCSKDMTATQVASDDSHSQHHP